MKLTVNLIRIFVGVLFIFSGVVKAIDPLGLAYKMQEFFEAWSGNGAVDGTWGWCHSHALLFAVLMNTLEVALGVALLVCWQKKLTTWLLLLLMIFFLYLTSYVLFSGKVQECGCFGDCIPLTPMQTFIKDVILLILIIYLLIFRKHFIPAIKPIHRVGILFLSLMLVSFLQSNALEHLPSIDCLPYKKGNNLLKLREMPPDTTGTPPPLIDFSLSDENGNDSTEAVLSQHNKYYLFFIKSKQDARSDWPGVFVKLLNHARIQKRKVYVITAQLDSISIYLNKENNYNVPVYNCDGTAIKTAARCMPTIYLMDGPVVLGKWSWEDVDEATSE